MKYKRVAQRLREKFQDKEFTLKDLENAIFVECGTDQRTVESAIDRMLRLELIHIVKEKAREFGVMRIVKYKLSPTDDEYF